MGCGHHTLPVDLDDPMPDTDASSLRYSPSHEAADLPEPSTKLHLLAGRLRHAQGQTGNCLP
jgi:hypothetical protein